MIKKDFIFCPDGNRGIGFYFCQDRFLHSPPIPGFDFDETSLLHLEICRASDPKQVIENQDFKMMVLSKQYDFAYHYLITLPTVAKDKNHKTKYSKGSILKYDWKYREEELKIELELGDKLDQEYCYRGTR